MSQGLWADLKLWPDEKNEQRREVERMICGDCAIVLKGHLVRAVG